VLSTITKTFKIDMVGVVARSRATKQSYSMCLALLRRYVRNLL